MYILRTGKSYVNLSGGRAALTKSGKQAKRYRHLEAIVNLRTKACKKFKKIPSEFEIVKLDDKKLRVAKLDINEGISQKFQRTLLDRLTDNFQKMQDVIINEIILSGASVAKWYNNLRHLEAKGKIDFVDNEIPVFIKIKAK